MATAGYGFKILVSATSGGTYSEVPSTDGSFNRTRNIIETTDTSNAGFAQRLPGLLDTAISTEANWSASDTALGVIETAFENGDTMYVKFLPDNVAGNGYKVPVIVENFSISSPISDKLSVSISFQGNGQPQVDNA
jgi:TP901-1 family phage major tail protein